MSVLFNLAWSGALLWAAAGIWWALRRLARTQPAPVDPEQRPADTSDGLDRLRRAIRDQQNEDGAA